MMKTLKSILALIALNLFVSLACAETQESLSVKPIPNILVLGDSLSAAHRLPLSQGWVALLQNQLDSESTNIHVENASVSGLTTGAALQKVNALLNTYRPSLMILELGANDGLQGKPLNYIQTNLEKLIESALQNQSKVLLLGVHLPPNLGKRYTEPFFELYKTIADKHQIGLISFMLEGVATHQDLMLPDGLHPNEEGQKKVFEHLWPGLKQAITTTDLVRY